MATVKQKIAVDKTLENLSSSEPKTQKQILLESGYSENIAKQPTQVTESKGFRELLELHLPDSLLTEKHKELLTSTTLDHMTFPKGAKDEKDLQKLIEQDMALAQKEGKEYVPQDYLTDQDIKELLASVNCTVRRIVHGDQARHVYFWSADNRARKDGLDMGYKLKGAYAPDKSLNVNIDVKATLTDEDRKLIELIRQNDKTNDSGGSEVEAVELEGILSVGVDTESQNQNQ